MRRMIKIAARQGARESFAYDDIVVGDEAAALHLMNAEFDGRERRESQGRNVRARLRLQVAGRGERQNFLLRVGYQTVAIHRNSVVCTEEAEGARLFRRGRNLCHRYG